MELSISRIKAYQNSSLFKKKKCRKFTLKEYDALDTKTLARASKSTAKTYVSYIIN